MREKGSAREKEITADMQLRRGLRGKTFAHAYYQRSMPRLLLECHRAKKTVRDAADEPHHPP